MAMFVAGADSDMKRSSSSRTVTLALSVVAVVLFLCLSAWRGCQLTGSLFHLGANGDIFSRPDIVSSESRRFLVDVRSIPIRKPDDISKIRPAYDTVGEEHSISTKKQEHSSVEKAPPFSTSFASWFATGSKTVAKAADVRHNSNFISPPQHTGHALALSNRTWSGSSADDLSTEKLTKEQCKAKYGERRYLPLEQKKFPPMLYTFPGSGNTWCRLLIEYGTGIYSGSVYNDQTLLHSLPGEFTCNWQVSVIKIHPHTHPFEGLRTGVFNSDANKCKRGGVDKIRRAILLIRDPYDSIWSEFQRRITQSHVGGVLKANFNWPRWQANAAALSHAYNLMWAVHHAGIEKHFAEKDILYLKYEDLKNKATRVDTLMKVAKFLAISHPTREQLECAFALADNRETHRIVDKTLTMSKDEAYTHPLACRMWALFGKHAAKHGYKVWRNYDCSKNFTGPGTPVPIDANGDANANVYPPIPRVNVGPQGEYDRKWVKPGASLLDFGGHPPSPGGSGGNPNSGGNHNAKAVHITKGGGGGAGGKKGPAGNMQKKVPPNKPQKPGATVRPLPASMRAGAAGATAGGATSAGATAGATAGAGAGDFAESKVDSAAPSAQEVVDAASATMAGAERSNQMQVQSTVTTALAGRRAPASGIVGAPKFRLVTPIPPPSAPSSGGVAGASGGASGTSAPLSDGGGGSGGVLSSALASASNIAAAIANSFHQEQQQQQLQQQQQAAVAPESAAAMTGAGAIGDSGAEQQQFDNNRGSLGLGLGLGLGKKGRGAKKKGFGGAGLGGGSGKKRVAAAAGAGGGAGVRAVGSDNNSGVRGGVDAGSDLTAAATGSETIQQGGGGGAGLRKDRLRSGRGGNKLRTQVVTGMTLEQASQKGAVIANVGADKPAWQ